MLRHPVGEGDDRPMTLIEQARAALRLAQPREVAFVRPDAVAVRLAGVGGLGQRVADRREHARVAAVADLRLQAVVVGDAEVGQHADLAHAAVHGQDGTVAFAAATLLV
jgi:hypothetical protein